MQTPLLLGITSHSQKPERDQHGNEHDAKAGRGPRVVPKALVIFRRLVEANPTLMDFQAEPRSLP